MAQIRRRDESERAMRSFRPSRLSEISRKNRQEIIKARLSRRELFRMGLITSSGYLVHKSGLSAWADKGCNPGECRLGCSPPRIPVGEPIPFPPPLPARDPAVDPAFTFSPPYAVPNRATNPATGIPFEGRTQVHQFRDRFPVQQFFATRMRPNFNATFSDDPRNLARIGKNLIWGFNKGSADPADVALSPGPLIAPRYGL